MEAIVFDLDETLIDRGASLARYASILWADTVPQGFTEAAFVSRFMRLDGNGYVPRPEFFQRLSAEVIADFTAAQIEEHFYQHAWIQPLLFAGAAQGLTALAARGLKLGIVSNGRARSQKAKIERTGLAELVDGYVISETFGEKKPHPSIYQEIFRQLDIDPKRAWFVGDHPVLDICGSAKMGFKTLWIERNTAWPDDQPRCADIVVSSLAEAFEALLVTDINEEEP